MQQVAQGACWFRKAGEIILTAGNAEKQARAL
jgi:hypothetical protein